MPVRRGHVAPRTTLIETIIRKFDTDSKYGISSKPNFTIITVYDYESMADRRGRRHSGTIFHGHQLIGVFWNESQIEVKRWSIGWND